MPVRPEDRREPVARFFARSIHVASWVDYLIFIMSTPEHSDCVGFKGGCAVCGEFYGRALKVQEMWLKARALNMPLSTKGQAIGRRGALAGLGIDTHRGRFHMLPEKLASMISARDDLAAASLSTPRIIARVRGKKALHYGCVIPLVD